jgi:hypothetical protein
VIDAKTGKRISKLELKHEIDSVGVSQDAKPQLYGRDDLRAGAELVDARYFLAGLGIEDEQRLGAGGEFLLGDQRAASKHKAPSRFLFVIDAKTGKRISKLETCGPAPSWLTLDTSLPVSGSKMNSVLAPVESA